jgi:hypothetical protein
MAVFRNWEQFQICSVFFYTPCRTHLLTYVYASVNSSIAHPPTPRATPGHLYPFLCPVAGHWYLQSCPGDGELFTGRAFVSTGHFCDADKHVLLRSLSFTFPENRKRQVRTFLAKFSLNVFVSYFLSCVERISMNCSFKTQVHLLFIAWYRKIFLCLVFDV